MPKRFWVALGVLAAVLAIGTFGYRLLVGGSWFESLYMTVITLSTTGYGEVLPGLSHSVAGRAFTMLMIIFGMGLLLWVVGNTTAFLVEGQLTHILRRRKMEKSIAAMEDHVIVCGAGTTGIEVITELLAVRVPCVVIDVSPEQIGKALHKLSFTYLEGDATSEEFLVAAGIQRARGVVSVLPEDKDNLVVTFMARQLNPGVRIVSRAFDASIRDRLLRAGASGVVFPNRIGGLRLVSELVRPHVVSFLDRMLRPAEEEVWRFEEIEITRDSAAAGKTLGSLRLAERAGVPILALTEGEGGSVQYYPGAGTVLRPASRLVVMGNSSQVETLRGIVRNG